MNVYRTFGRLYTTCYVLLELLEQLRKPRTRRSFLYVDYNLQTFVPLC
jgi:hypothetical protein